MTFSSICQRSIQTASRRVGLLIGFSDHVALDLGYRFKAISDIELDDPVFCGGEDCDPPVEEFTADDHFGLHQHVAQIGITIGF